MFGPVDRRYELEILRRSLVMLHPDARPLLRDQAVALVEELADLQARIRRMAEVLAQLLVEVESAQDGLGTPPRSTRSSEGGATSGV